MTLNPQFWAMTLINFVLLQEYTNQSFYEAWSWSKVFLFCLQLLPPLVTKYIVLCSSCMDSNYSFFKTKHWKLFIMIYTSPNWLLYTMTYRKLIMAKQKIPPTPFEKESQPTWRTKATTFVSAIYVKQHKTSRSTKIIKKNKKKCKQSNIYSAAYTTD